jgi:hypothetical protein
MTAYGYQPRTATPAGDAKGGNTPYRDARANTQMFTLSKNTLITASKRRVRGAGKSRRALPTFVSRGVERSIKRRVERVERRSVHQRGGEQVGEVVEGRGQVSEEKKSHCAHDTQNTCVHPHVSLGGKRWARRGGMATVLDTQGKRWRRPGQPNPRPPRAHVCYGMVVVVAVEVAVVVVVLVGG